MNALKPDAKPKEGVIQHSIRSYKHKQYSIASENICLNPTDDKRVYDKEMIYSRPYGYDYKACPEEEKSNSDSDIDSKPNLNESVDIIAYDYPSEQEYDSDCEYY